MEYIKNILHILSGDEKRLLLMTLLMMMIGMLFEMAGVGIILPIFALIASPEEIADMPMGDHLIEIVRTLGEEELIVYAVLFFISFAAIKFLFLMALTYVQSRLTYNILAGVSSRLYAGYLRAGYDFHLQNNSAKLIRNATTEVQVFAQNLIAPAMTLFTEGLVAIGIIGLLIAINPKGTGLVVLFIAVVGFMFVRVTRGLSKKWGVERQDHEGERVKVIQEGLACIKEITLLGRTKFYQESYRNEAALS